MAHKGISGLLLASVFFASLGVAGAQAPTSRLAGDWRSAGTATISARVPARPMTGETLGAAPGEMRLERMILLLEPAADRKKALDQELGNLQNPASAAYHRWLTPAAFADAYANSSSDVAAVAAWLSGEGFTVAPIPAGRGWIEFSGTAAQVEQAFQTKVVLAAANGGKRAILAGGQIGVPAALKPLVRGLVSLDGAVSAAAITAPKPMSSAAADLAAQTSAAKAEALTPNLLGQWLHLDALHEAGTTGAGQTIAIAARAEVHDQDVAAFRAAFGLPASALHVVSGESAQDFGPGVLSDREAATAAASWAGAAAPGAQILLAPARTTSATDGVDLSLATIVDGALANTVSVGYTSCEAALSEAHQAFYAALYRQAAAEGIAVIAAAGDSGPAACHAAGSEAPVSSGYAVNALAATPWNTAAGVAAFAADGTAGLAAWSPLTPADPAYAGGGGASDLYDGPAWQPTGALQASGRRLPDVALPTAVDSSASRGLAFCFGESTGSADCTLARSGGSSMAAAVFAGVAALLAQKDGAQGNLAPGLYGLSAAGGVFSDVKQGNAQLACTASSTGCSATGKIGYAAEEGYDQATGLGGVNAQALVAQWKAQPMASGQVSVSIGVTPVVLNATYNPAAEIALTANVVSQSGGATPSGSVSFLNTATGQPLNGSNSAGLDSNGNASLNFLLSDVFSSTGSYQVQANYFGDGTYGALNSQPITITTEKSCSVLTVVPATTTPAAGSNLSVTVNFGVSTLCGPPAGVLAPTGTVTLNVSGGAAQNYTAPLVAQGNAATASFSIPISSTSNGLQAVYAGDGNYAGVTGSMVTLNVQSVLTVTLTPATLTPAAGSSLQLNLSVTPPTGSSTPAAGSVTVTMDGSTVGIAQLTPGTPSSTASLTITAPAAGTHTLLASYTSSNNGVYSTATSPQVTITVGKASTTLAVNPATTTPVGGSTILVTALLSATISGTNIPTGTVTFTLDGAVQGTGPQTLMAGATASILITAPANGSHTLQASYSGDSNYAASTAPAVTLNVAKSPTTLYVTPSTTTPAIGAALPVTATLTATSPLSTPPSGTITLTLDGTAIGIATTTGATSSTVSFTVPGLTPGPHSLAAVYSGDTNYASALATAVTVTVPKSPTTLAITPATTSPAPGGSLFVSAVLNAAQGSSLPSGTVTYTVDGVSVGTSVLVTGYPATSTYTIPLVNSGTHSLQAVYSGDSYYGTSTSAPVTISVAKATTTTALTVSNLTPTAGGSMAVTVAVTSPTPEATNPSGTVSIAMDGVTVANGAVTPGSPSTASVTMPLVVAGSHVLQAVYAGDNFYTGSTSLPTTIVAAKGATTTTLTATPATLTAGTSETLTATVAPVNPLVGVTYTITGAVNFYDGGGTLLGTAAVAGNTATLPGVKLANNASHSIAAIYVGDVNWLGSASAALPLASTTLPDTVVLTSNVAATSPGEAVILIATVTPTMEPLTGAEQNPTGNVVFYNGTTALGQAALVPAPLTDAATATLTLQTMPGGQDTVYAVYQGDLSYDRGTSNPLTLTVEDFTIAPASTNPSTNLTIVKGSSGSASFVIAGVGGFNNEVQVVCTVPSQDDMTCTATPQQVIPTATVTFVVQTFETGSMTSAANRRQPLWPRAAGGTALAALAFFVLPFGKRSRMFARAGARRFCILLLLLVGLGAAGLGCNSVSGIDSSSSGTALGVATLKITANAYVDNTVVSRSEYLTVNVVAQ